MLSIRWTVFSDVARSAAGEGCCATWRCSQNEATSSGGRTIGLPGLPRRPKYLPRFPLKGSFKGGIDTGIDIDVDIDIDLDAWET